jgi:hypothetical protein
MNSPLRMESLLKVMQLAETTGLDLQDCLWSIGCNADQVGEYENDARVIDAWRSGIALGSKQLVEVLRKSAMGGNTTAARTLINRTGQAQGDVDDAENHRRRGKVVHVNVIESVDRALAEQRRLIEAGFEEDADDQKQG